MKNFIQKLRQIKKYCAEHDDQCNNCIYDDDETCRIQTIMTYLANHPPIDWNVDDVEERLNDVD